MAKKYKTSFQDTGGNWHHIERDSVGSVYGYKLKSEFDIEFDTQAKKKQLQRTLLYSCAPNWTFKKNEIDYVGFEELESLTQQQNQFSTQHGITWVGNQNQFIEWLNATTKVSMAIHKVKQAYRAVKEWIME